MLLLNSWANDVCFNVRFSLLFFLFDMVYGIEGRKKRVTFSSGQFEKIRGNLDF